MSNWWRASEPLFILGVLGLGTFIGINVQAQYYSAVNYAQNTSTTPNMLENAEDITIGEMLAGQESDSNPQEPGHPVMVTPVMYRGEVPATTPTKDGSYTRNANYTSSENLNGNAYSAGMPVRMPSPRVQQTAYEEVSAPTAPTTVTPAVASVSPKKSEPRTLPEDFPAGEMAPLNPNGLIAFSETATTQEGQIQQITIIDPTQKVLCVYHINMTSGQIELKSARKIEWDLQLIFLNSKRPLPQDVQAILEQNPRRR